MLNNIRNFAKTKSAGVLVAILIVPFVMWGMGGVFSGGNKNNIAKISNENISTVDFQNHLNSSNIGLEKIKKNIDQNIIEEILGGLISKKMLSMEINDLKLIISDRILNKKIKGSKNFLDENNKFSRIKYEKFLLSNKITAPGFESRLRQSELQKDLFNYIGGGIYTPLFLVNKSYKDQAKKVTINYINLTNNYKQKNDFTNDDILKFVEENKEDLKEKFVSFKFTKITPKSLIGLDDFNNLFFEKIDDLESEISSGSTFENLIKKFNLEENIVENFKINNDNNKNEFYKKIYENAEVKKFELLDENDFYILYEVTKIQKILPNIKSEKFIEKIKEILFNKSKNDFNYDLIKKISQKSFNQENFEEISTSNSSGINKTVISSINDNKKFTNDSVKHLYSLPRNSFGLIGDDDKNIYLIKIIDVSYKNISKTSEDFLTYKKQANDEIKDTIFSSYDLFLNSKHNIKINEKTLERVKNYFR